MKDLFDDGSDGRRRRSSGRSGQLNVVRSYHRLLHASTPIYIKVKVGFSFGKFLNVSIEQLIRTPSGGVDITRRRYRGNRMRGADDARGQE